MSSKTNLEKDEFVPAELKTDGNNQSAKHDAVSQQASRKDGMPSDLSPSLVPSANITSSNKGENKLESVGAHGFNQATGCYNYYYPGYSGLYAQEDGSAYLHTNGSHTDMQSNNGSLLYYLPGYNAYATGTLVGADGQCVGQQPYYSSAGYIQHPVSYGSEVMPCYSWDSTYGDCQNGNAGGFGNTKYGGPSAFTKSNTLNSVKANESVTSKISKSSYTQPNKPLSKVNQVGSDFSAGPLKGYQQTLKFSSTQRQGLFPHNRPLNYKTNGRLWNVNDRFKSRDTVTRTGDLETSHELVRGPRYLNKNTSSDSSVEKEDFGLTVRRDQYNLPDFQIEYEKAKFYVIKSYSEDDIHKCIKYDVWSSTPNGNKKLNAAFSEAEAKANETGARCPIFLFFSVNTSGQFVGLAEMIGPVDFNKDMDFWLVDKWSGFFPVKWHVIKDVPNNQLRHIILENNDNKPVTHSRDTQEIGLEQGLEMLKVFRNFSVKTSLLDDFSFYENREKSLQAKKIKPATLQMELYKEDDFPSHPYSAEREFEHPVRGNRNTDTTSLINLTKNLSLNARTQKNDAVKNPIEISAPVAAP